MFRKMKDLFSGAGGRAAATGPVEYLVVGLGNPGKQYENTRHNAGFLALEHIARETGTEVKKLKFKALCGDAMIAGRHCVLLKPSTFMNLSGEAVRDAARFYKLPLEQVVVLSDDVNLDVGRMRVRRSGSDGGQKGLKNIIYLTGKDTFPRVRIGVGKKPHPDMELADWVLGQFSKEDRKALEPVLENAAKAVELIVGGDIQEAMNRFN